MNLIFDTKNLLSVVIVIDCFNFPYNCVIEPMVKRIQLSDGDSEDSYNCYLSDEDVSGNRMKRSERIQKDYKNSPSKLSPSKKKKKVIPPSPEQVLIQVPYIFDFEVKLDLGAILCSRSQKE